MTASCTPSRLSLFSAVAPEKRQLERSTVPESDGIFMPGIRPDSGCCKPVSMLGLAGCAFRKAARRSQVRFLRPASSRHHAGSFLNCLETDHVW